MAGVSTSLLLTKVANQSDFDTNISQLAASTRKQKKSSKWCTPLQEYLFKKQENNTFIAYRAL